MLVVPSQSPISCVDAFAEFGEFYVIIERLTLPFGFALVGGRIELGEDTESAVVREFREETDFSLIKPRRLGFYDAPGRDPRGYYVSTLFSGIAVGMPRSEVKKTRIHLWRRSDIEKRLGDFVLDHGQMIADYFQIIDS